MPYLSICNLRYYNIKKLAIGHHRNNNLTNVNNNLCKCMVISRYSCANYQNFPFCDQL